MTTTTTTTTAKPSASMIASRLAAAAAVPTASAFSAAPSITAAPVIVSRGENAPAAAPAAGQGEPGDETQDAQGRKIFRPPSMTLDQGEAFAHAQGRKRAAPGGQAGAGRKKKWRKVRARVLAFSRASSSALMLADSG